MGRKRRSSGNGGGGSGDGGGKEGGGGKQRGRPKFSKRKIVDGDMAEEESSPDVNLEAELRTNVSTMVTTMGGKTLARPGVSGAGRRRGEEKKERGEYDEGCCRLCMEDGTSRICCGNLYCDACFGSRQKCPSCGVALDHGRPIIKHENDDLAIKDILECRRCLKPGYRRKCCSEYYCNECYYMTGFCPSCETPVTKTGVSDSSGGLQVEDPGFYPVLISWIMAWGLVGAVLLLSLLMLVNDLSTPQTVSDFLCYGVHSQCSKDDICMEWSPEAVGPAGGSLGKESVQNMTTWKPCTLQSRYKMMGPMCVFDPQLYDMSGGLIGYDLCSKGFDNGYLNFHDNFENWPNATGYKGNLMKSAQWDTIVNAQVDDLCGAGQGHGALHFSGQDYRYAQTLPLDVAQGGTIRFQLTFGYKRNDPVYSDCKPALKGNVLLKYSVDGGTSWGLVAEYPPMLYSEERFYDISVQVPREAWSLTTRFRFQQEDFDEEVDHWAIDHVRIIHSFPADWKDAPLYKSVKRATDDYIDNSQCCYRTVQCDTWTLNNPPQHCHLLSGYTPREHPLHGVEMFTVVAFIVFVLRAAYSALTSQSILGLADRWRRVKKVAADKPPPGMLNSDFKLRFNRTWRLVAALLVVLPYGGMFLLCSYYLNDQAFLLTESFDAMKGMGSYTVGGATLEEGFATVHVETELVAIFIMAAFLDGKDVIRFLWRTICCLPGSMPAIYVDASPHINNWQIGASTISLDDVVEITRFSKRYCYLCALGAIVGTMPYTLITLFMGLSHVYYPAYRILRFFGLFLILFKAFYGPDWLIKLVWSFYYMFTTDVRRRNEVGQQVKKRSSLIMGLYWAGVAGLISLITLSFVRYTWLPGGLAVSVLLGFAFGFTLGVGRGLPLVPFFILTILDTGIYVRITRRKVFPCMYRCKHFAGLHHRDEVVILFVEDDFKLISLLKGVPVQSIKQ